MRRVAVAWVIVTAVVAGCSNGSGGGPFGSGTTNGVSSSVPSSGTNAPVTTVPMSLPAGCSLETAGPLVTGTDFYTVPDVAEPPVRHWYRDPTFGTCVVRVTDRGSDLDPDDPSPGITNDYSRVPAFNADGSLLLLRSTEGIWYLYDAATLQPIRSVPVEVEPRWDPADPAVIHHHDGTRLLAYNVTTGDESLVHDFASDLPGMDLVAVWTREEGRPSADGRYWAMQAQNTDWQTVAFLVYDREADTVTVRDLRSLPGVEEGIDHVAMSPLGTYFLASVDHYCEHGQLGTDAEPCGLMVYNRDLQEGRSLLRIIGHHDVVLDAEGREAVIFQDVDTDEISMLDLESGTVTPLLPIDFSYTAIGLHFSGLGFDRPGWVLVSTYDDDPVAHTWMDDQVFLVELAAGGRVVRLAYNHSVRDEAQEVDYWAEPHATTDRSLTRIVFSSNWGRTGSGEEEVYLIALPPDWPDLLGPASGG